MKKGISLIVLVITIIVMIILAASVVITLSNTGVINRASQAVDLTNEAAVQDLAALTWADAYMDNKRGTDLVNEVTAKLGEQGVTADKWNITVTDTGVSVTSKNGEWVTIYSGGGTTEDGVLKVADYAVFNTKDKYRITISGPEYTGTIELNRAISMSFIHILAFIDDNKVFTFDSVYDVDAKAGDIIGEETYILGQNIEDENGNVISQIAFTKNGLEETVQDIYRIDKIERQEQGNIVYSGNVPKGEMITLENVDMSDELVVENNGTFYSAYPTEGAYLMWDMFGFKAIGVAGLDTSGKVKYVSNVESGNTTIYTLGKNPYVIYEGLYVASNINNKVVLTAWPDDMTVVPQKVAGKTVTGIAIKNQQKIYIDRDLDIMFEVGYMNDYIYCNVELASNVSPEKLFEAIISYGHNLMYNFIVDLSALQSVEIPERILEIFDSNSGTIYVSPAVKANYPQSYIVAK